MSEAVLVATAGHVDHGKSTLVKALTGTDPDRWAEEKRRGITIDLGFAHAAMHDRVYSFVDVPGHEKFIHNMLAGIGAIDAVLFVIAADESVMPQTREHARALSYLGVRQVCVVLTKIDLVDDELLELLTEEVTTWLEAFGWEGAPCVHFSAKRPETRAAVDAALAAFVKKSPPPGGGFRLSVDRVFTAQGSGTVVTGTVERGRLQAEDTVCIQPQGITGRVRRLQMHGAAVDAAGPHTRVAVNLSDVHYGRLHRGDQLFSVGGPRPTRRMLVRLDVFEDGWAPGPKHVFHLHHLAAGLSARLMWVQAPFAMLALETPHCFQALDRGLLRDGHPLRVIAGFEVLDPHPDALRPRRLQGRLSDIPPTGDLHAWQAWYLRGATGVLKADAVTMRCGSPLAEDLRGDMVFVGKDEMVRADLWEGYRHAFVDGLKLCHKKHPLYSFIPRTLVLSYFRDQGRSPKLTLKILELLKEAGEVEVDGDRLSYAKHRVVWREDMFAALQSLLAPLAEPPGIIDFKGRADAHKASAPLIELLLWERYVVPLTPGVLMGAAHLNRVMDTLHARFQNTAFSIQELKETFDFSRKVAIPLLEYLDKNGLTRREGDQRVWIAREVPHITSKWVPPERAG